MYARLGLICCLVPLSACGGDSAVPSSGGSDMTSSAACSASDFNTQVVAFCKTQFPAAPAAGKLGASCTGDGQCDSNICLMPFGSGQQYCSLACPQGTECPVGYTCQDAGAGNGSLCYDSICIYGGSDNASCVTNVKQAADFACLSGCKAELSTWLDCLVTSRRICSNSDADALCGVELGLLKSCSPGVSQDF